MLDYGFILAVLANCDQHRTNRRCLHIPQPRIALECDHAIVSCDGIVEEDPKSSDYHGLDENMTVGVGIIGGYWT